MRFRRGGGVTAGGARRRPPSPSAARAGMRIFGITSSGGERGARPVCYDWGVKPCVRADEGRAGRWEMVGMDKEERKAQAAKHNALMKGAFSGDTETTVAAAAIYEEGRRLKSSFPSLRSRRPRPW